MGDPSGLSRHGASRAFGFLDRWGLTPILSVVFAAGLPQAMVRRLPEFGYLVNN